MNKTRYKIRKQQLERVVESFVTESAAPEAKKHVQGYNDKEDESLGMKDGKKSSKKISEKGRRNDSKGKWGSRLKHASEAKKHKMSMGGEQSNDMGQGMKKASQSSSPKMKHAPEAKKHVKGSVSESKLNKLKQFMLENDITESDLEEGWLGDKLGTSSKAKREFLKKDFILKAKLWKEQGKIRSFDQKQLDDLLKKAEEDNYEGKVGYDEKTKSMSYRDSENINWAGLGLARSGSFGGTGEGRGI